jgi:Zn-finger nucleic acid-binding protein
MKFSTILTLAAMALMSADTDARIGQPEHPSKAVPSNNSSRILEVESSEKLTCHSGSCAGKFFPGCTDSKSCAFQCHGIWLDCTEGSDRKLEDDNAVVAPSNDSSNDRILEVESSEKLTCHSGSCAGKFFPGCTDSKSCAFQCHGIWLDCTEGSDRKLEDDNAVVVPSNDSSNDRILEVESLEKLTCHSGSCAGKFFPGCTDSKSCAFQCHGIWLDCTEGSDRKLEDDNIVVVPSNDSSNDRILEVESSEKLTCHSGSCAGKFFPGCTDSKSCAFQCHGIWLDCN